MSKRQKIISCLETGLTANETMKEVPDATLSYIYKTRSLYRKENKVNSSTKKQDEILRLSKQKVPVEEIAKEVDCSIQYVYRVIKNKPDKQHNPRMLLLPTIYKKQDEYYTPLYAIIPITKHLKPNSVIWCPFDKEQSLYVRYFRSLGHTVIHTHIEYGQDFFRTTPPENCDYIISNPPYSCKEMIFERLFEFDIPFAMLVNTVGIFTAKSRFKMFKDNVEMMVFQARVQYLTSYEDTTTLNNPPFASGYICSRVLNEKLVFAKIERLSVSSKITKTSTTLLSSSSL